MCKYLRCMRNQIDNMPGRALSQTLAGYAELCLSSQTPSEIAAIVGQAGRFISLRGQALNRASISEKPEIRCARQLGFALRLSGKVRWTFLRLA